MLVSFFFFFFNGETFHAVMKELDIEQTGKSGVCVCFKR